MAWCRVAELVLSSALRVRAWQLISKPSSSSSSASSNTIIDNDDDEALSLLCICSDSIASGAAFACSISRDSINTINNNNHHSLSRLQNNDEDQRFNHNDDDDEDGYSCPLHRCLTTLISVAAGMTITPTSSTHSRDQSKRLHGSIDRAYRAIVTSPHCVPKNRGLWAARYLRFVATSAQWQILPSPAITSGPSSGSTLTKPPSRPSSSSSHASTHTPSPCPVALARRSCEEARSVYTLVMDAVCARPELRVG